VPSETEKGDARVVRTDKGGLLDVWFPLLRRGGSIPGSKGGEFVVVSAVFAQSSHEMWRGL
jgi:hypothetical protein